MPLINLQTNLKSLRYGADRQGGGDSGLPYIQTNIENANPGIKFDDGLVRGGTVNAAVAGAIDTARIAKFLVDAPKGPLFIVKQIGLQLANPRLEVPKNPSNIASGFPENALAVGTNGLLEPTRIYNLGINTLAQVPVNAFGAHFNRHGLLPVQTDASKYEAIVTANNDVNGSSKFNRLVGLTNKFKLGDRKGSAILRLPSGGILGALINLVSNVPVVSKILNNFKPQDLIIDKYASGPASVYGIGETIINRYSFTENSSRIRELTDYSSDYAGKTRNQTTGAPESLDLAQDKGTGINSISSYPAVAKIGNDEINTAINLNTFNYNPALKTYAAIQSQVIQQQGLQNVLGNINLTVGIGGVPVIPSLSPRFKYNQFGIYNTETGTYSSTNVGKIGYQNSYGDTVVISGSIGSSWNRVAREQRVGSGRQDLINLTPIFDESSYYGNDYIIIGGDKQNIRDLVRFRIQAVDTDNPDRGKWMVFRAYISNLSDDINSEWTDIKYAGRGEKFYIYNGFTRRISLTFKVAALSVQEMKFIYSKLNFLMSNTMPDYNQNNLMRGPLVRMSVGSWLDSQLGKIDSISLKVPDDSPWEISLNDNLLILPHVVEVTMTFTPIGAESRGANLIPEKSTYTSYIAQNNTGADKATLQYVDPVPVINNTEPGETSNPNTPSADNVNTKKNNDRAQQIKNSKDSANINNNLISGKPTIAIPGRGTATGLPNEIQQLPPAGPTAVLSNVLGR
jgi:hypothetical protein